VAYSPDGRYVATTSVDDTMRLWNARTGQLMQADHDETPTGDPSFDPTGAFVAEYNSETQIRLWPDCPDCGDPGALLEASGASVVSPLTPLERETVASKGG